MLGDAKFGLNSGQLMVYGGVVMALAGGMGDAKFGLWGVVGSY